MLALNQCINNVDLVLEYLRVRFAEGFKSASVLRHGQATGDDAPSKGRIGVAGEKGRSRSENGVSGGQHGGFGFEYASIGLVGGYLIILFL